MIVVHAILGDAPRPQKKLLPQLASDRALSVQTGARERRLHALTIVHASHVAAGLAAHRRLRLELLRHARQHHTMHERRGARRGRNHQGRHGGQHASHEQDHKRADCEFQRGTHTTGLHERPQRHHQTQNDSQHRQWREHALHEAHKQAAIAVHDARQAKRRGRVSERQSDERNGRAHNDFRQQEHEICGTVSETHAPLIHGGRIISLRAHVLRRRQRTVRGFRFQPAGVEHATLQVLRVLALTRVKLVVFPLPVVGAQLQPGHTETIIGRHTVPAVKRQLLRVRRSGRDRHVVADDAAVCFSEIAASV